MQWYSWRIDPKWQHQLHLKDPLITAAMSKSLEDASRLHALVVRAIGVIGLQQSTWPRPSQIYNTRVENAWNLNMQTRKTPRFGNNLRFIVLRPASSVVFILSCLECCHSWNHSCHCRSCQSCWRYPSCHSRRCCCHQPRHWPASLGVKWCHLNRLFVSKLLFLDVGIFLFSPLPCYRFCNPGAVNNLPKEYSTRITMHTGSTPMRSTNIADISRVILRGIRLKNHEKPFRKNQTAN